MSIIDSYEKKDVYQEESFKRDRLMRYQINGLRKRRSAEFWRTKQRDEDDVEDRDNEACDWSGGTKANRTGHGPKCQNLDRCISVNVRFVN